MESDVRKRLRPSIDPCVPSSSRPAVSRCSAPDATRAQSTEPSLIRTMGVAFTSTVGIYSSSEIVLGRMPSGILRAAYFGLTGNWAKWPRTVSYSKLLNVYMVCVGVRRVA
ncbi:hypothetical protein LshimejAT787_0411020 [Lyophyllum shimeji]|uniref:Uncharacterized protein n=1 Tax=Lyophyllum shimeji TaxID=47721 RepID=A0A9P3UP88_LYOSH|nr:hypothetical protein LshimejAT787_0411020 [Lyophyllum shimeji]